MKKPNLIRLIAILFLTTITCTVLIGQIIYHDFVPNQSVTYYDPGGNSYSFDVNYDGINDLKLEGNSWFTPIHFDCCWDDRIRLVNLTNIEIAVSDSCNPMNYGCNTAYQPANVLIYDRFQWNNDYSWFVACGPSYGGSCSCQAAHYFYPFRVVINDSSYQYGWLRMSRSYYINSDYVHLYNMAINLDTNSSIYTTYLAVGIDQDKNLVSQLNISPNPFTDKISIKSRRDFKMIEIYDINGKSYFAKTYTQGINSEILDLSNLDKGIYILKIRKEEQYIIKKIIKI